LIAVIDYGMGNLRSVAKALELSGGEVSVSASPDDILRADSIVLPGVGAFSAGMKNLESLGLIPAIKEAVKEGKPFLGICLGMQLMFDESEEGAKCPGLGLLRGGVKRFGGEMRVPHVGWNTVVPSRKSRLFSGIEGGSYFYFVHSYYVEPAEGEIVLAETSYGVEFASAAVKDNLYLVQFHPEKSRDGGLRLLANFSGL
jgi:imidazole glycerol-phosphate synthase subunit HisH